MAESRFAATHSSARRTTAFVPCRWNGAPRPKAARRRGSSPSGMKYR